MKPPCVRLQETSSVKVSELQEKCEDGMSLNSSGVVHSNAAARTTKTGLFELTDRRLAPARPWASSERQVAARAGCGAGAGRRSPQQPGEPPPLHRHPAERTHPAFPAGRELPNCRHSPWRPPDAAFTLEFPPAKERLPAGGREARGGADSTALTIAAGSEGAARALPPPVGIRTGERHGAAGGGAEAGRQRCVGRPRSPPGARRVPSALPGSGGADSPPPSPRPGALSPRVGGSRERAPKTALRELLVYLVFLADLCIRKWARAEVAVGRGERLRGTAAAARSPLPPSRTRRSRSGRPVPAARLKEERGQKLWSPSVPPLSSDVRHGEHGHVLPEQGDVAPLRGALRGRGGQQRFREHWEQS